MWGVVKNEIIASVSLLYFNDIAHPVLVWSLLCTCFCHNAAVEGTMLSALLKIDEKGVGVGFRACVECSVVFFDLCLLLFLFVVDACEIASIFL